MEELNYLLTQEEDQEKMRERHSVRKQGHY